MGSSEIRDMGWWKSISVNTSEGSGIYGNILDEEVGQGTPEGATRQGGAPPRARPPPLPPPRGSSGLDSKSSGCLLVQEKSS